MNSKIDLPHLRQVRLTVFETKVLGLLMHCGGEYPMPDTQIARSGLEGLRAKGLVEMSQVSQRAYVRLTDEGRTVCAQLEAMTVQPKIEVVNQ